jgi:hypothetical protein
LFQAFRRRYQFADRSRRELFRDALHARIGDESARFLIFQAVRERDPEMLRVFGTFPLAFENLRRMPNLLKELVNRFAPEFAEKINTRAKRKTLD